MPLINPAAGDCMEAALKAMAEQNDALAAAGRAQDRGDAITTANRIKDAAEAANRCALALTAAYSAIGARAA